MPGALSGCNAPGRAVSPKPPPEQGQAPVSPHASLYTLTRQPGEDWGIEFASPVFDGVRVCVNNCCFCFMRMLPKGLRPSLYLRDDDYRLSFLQGNFVTLTNLSDADLRRITEMRLSPLNVSLHAVRAATREQLMGANHARGLECLEALLAAGIEIHAQIVLVPGINDGAVLSETLDWVLARPSISACGIVPYGYTRYAAIQREFSPEQCAELCGQLRPLAPRVQLADAFFLKAAEASKPGAQGYPDMLQSEQANIVATMADNIVPGCEYYGGYPLLEDGIGMVRSFLDAGCEAIGRATAAASQQADRCVLLATGAAFAPILRSRLADAPGVRVVAIENRFFGGSVDVAGLLCATDVVEQLSPILAEYGDARPQVLLPPAMFNDDNLTLDGQSLADIASALRCEVVTLSAT